MLTDPNKIIRTADEQSRANEIFDGLRDELLKRELSNTESYDKTILTLSSAALGISLTAIKFVVPLDQAEYIVLVKIGWIFLLLSVIASLIAFLISNKAISIQLKNAEEYYNNCLADAFNRKNIFITINGILNKLTGVLFVIGITAIVTFVLINIDSENKEMSKDIENTKETTVSLKESASIPSMNKVVTGNDSLSKAANIPTMQSAPGTQSSTQASDSSSTTTTTTSTSQDSSSNNSEGKSK